MLKRLRFQLTILYLLASMGLVALIGAGSYFLLQRYLQVAADQALQYKMALQFDQYGLALPPELAQAEQAWLKENSHGQDLLSTTAVTPAASQITLTHTPTPSPTLESRPTQAPTLAPSTQVPTLEPSSNLSRLIFVSSFYDKGDGQDDSSAGDNPGVDQNPDTQPGSPSPSGTITPLATAALNSSVPSRPPHGEINDDALDARLAPIFVTPLNDKGNVDLAAPAAKNPVLGSPPPLFDSQAAAAAMLTGVDWRTVLRSDGSRLRLLTYRTSSSTGPALLQAGRLLDDQDLLLKSFLTGILVLSGFSVILLGLASWWLSGRSLGPAEKAWEQQQAFISNASHELRTPLTLIQATTEVALRGKPDPQQKEHLKNILEEIHYMNHMVDDLLLLARRDARRLKLSREAVSLQGLFPEIRRQVEGLADEGQVDLILGQIKDVVWADPARLRQVLLILLDNAMRYTPPGGTICLDAARSGRLVKISISDNGPGIPAEHLPHVFERFYQMPRTGLNESRSNGLGLSIAKALVEAMGGGISIESQLGQGTRVTVELPVAR
jgi:signal transduction histidine kinase